jgi:3-hydroxyphenylacetate 6-hydroxylase
MGTAPMTKSLNRSRKDIPLGKPAIQTYVKYLDIETRDFMRQCLEGDRRPLDPLRMLQRMSLSLDLTLCWGRRISLEDPLLAEIAQVEHEIVNLRNPMTNLQDCIPALRFPWSRTTKKALELRQRRDTYFAQLNNDLDERVRQGSHTPCIRAELLHRPDVDEEELNLICLTFISAGMAPTVATLQWSIALLARRPDIQQTALHAIREHYKDNAPFGDADDNQGCQYIVALAKECLRYFEPICLAK